MKKCNQCEDEVLEQEIKRQLFDGDGHGQDLCPSCYKISTTPQDKYPFIVEWNFILYHAQKKLGFDWYKKARDKLIKKIEDHDRNQEDLLIKEIGKWKEK